MTGDMTKAAPSAAIRSRRPQTLSNISRKPPAAFASRFCGLPDGAASVPDLIQAAANGAIIGMQIKEFFACPKRPPFSNPPAHGGRTHAAAGGGGIRRKVKTTINRLRPDEVWHPRTGAPRGNRNAVKSDGRENLRRLKAAVRAFRARARAARQNTEKNGDLGTKERTQG
jgi:hypothetical protein